MTVIKPGDMLLTPDGYLLIAVPDHLADKLPVTLEPFDPFRHHTTEPLSFTDGDLVFNCEQPDGSEETVPYGCDFAGVVSDRGTWRAGVTLDRIVTILWAAVDGCMVAADACVKPGMADDPEERDAFLRDASAIQTLMLSIPD